MLEHDLAYQRNLLADEEYKMRPAKNVMLTVSIIHILFAVLAFFSGPKMKEEIIGTGILFFIGLIFFIFSFLILNHPRSVSIAGLVLYCLLLAFYALVAYFSGWFLIILLIILVPAGLWFLIRSLKHANSLTRQRQIVDALEGINMPFDQIA